MKKFLLITLIVVITISSAFSAMNFFPLKASSNENQVIGSLFYLQTINDKVTASSYGISTSFLNKVSRDSGIYANVGVGKAFAFNYARVTLPLENTVAVFLQSGPYYIIPLQDKMLVKVGAGLDLCMLGGKVPVTGDEKVAVSLGIGAMGAFEYELMEYITLVGSLTLGFDFVTWMTNVSGDLERASNGIIVNMMPSVGASYKF